MGIVAFAAVLLGCVVETYRIRRTQAFYLKEAAKYAQLEKFENNERDINLRSALVTKQFMEALEKFDRADSYQDHFVFPQVEHRVALTRERYYKNLEFGRKSLVRADVARIKAQRFSELKQRYEQAGRCFWLPFGPNPLKLVR